MRVRVVLSAAGITAASLVSSVAVMAAPSAPPTAAATATVPTAPRTPSITRGNGQVTVSWTAPESTGGSPITVYRVRVQPGHGAVTVAAPSTTATVTGLADGTQVTATVEAVNAIGKSPAAAVGTAIPSPPIANGLISPYLETHLQDLAVAPDQTLYASRADSIYKRPFGASTFTKLEVGTVTPWAVAAGAGGRVYWADQVNGHNVIRQYFNGQVTTVAGTASDNSAPAPSTTPTTATAVSIPSVLALAVNHADGSVFVLDYIRHTVLRFTVGGTIAVVAGVPTISPTGSFSGDGGPAIDAHFDRPQGLAVNEYGTVYVSDTFNDRVRAFTVGGTIQTVAGDGTETIDPAPDLDATATGVPNPGRIVWMPTRGLLVDSGGRKRLLPGDQSLTGRLQRIGDDAFDRALLDST
ncbi:MAG: fibronectin type III domain-containing protein, partial [Aquihabitans sp.]